MDFSTMIGHDTIKNQIVNSIKGNRFSHALIVTGENGIGKSLIAKEIAIRLLGKAEEKQYVDIVEFKMSKDKKSIGIDEIKSIIQETTKKPYEGDRKVIILYKADGMTEAAQNAFLKTIEEPPRGIFIILLCEKLENILDTIKSRCQVYKLNRLSEEEMLKFLNNKFESLSEDELKAVSAFSDGIPGRAERFLEDKSLMEIRDTVIDILKGICEGKLDKTLLYTEFLLKYRGEWQEVLTYFLSYIRDTLIYKETGNKELIINIDKINEIKDIAEMFSFNKLNGIINIIKDTRSKLERNVNATLVFDSMLVKIQEV
ncbi:DNA polymerase III subunit delta' [Clostridium magnum]|uniref:DNA polymerase III subunit delta' n=1 Tax=Clostridium magnum DSM 2767 TaxID=1121326 RepID=A0A162RIT5_9CLOT|nr:DNA polymerase III subunit delta' [Clostridium magnum]KZL89969.1 DNA polymerase III subunit delta' [Clostridium magnum DSM 2767]SHJ32637.1 DNA polymerase-3 subunit delta' [Clostridium magnum DSM 2767]